MSTVSRLCLVVWFTVLFIISWYSWNKESPNVILMTVPCLFGLAAFVQIQNQLIGPPSLTLTIVGILAGFVLCSAIFAMNLGHWYLNVPGLDLNHLMRAAYVFWAFVAARFLWDIQQLFTAKILYQGDFIPLYQFMARMDGFLLLIAIFFGTLFPLVAIYFVR